MYVWYGLPFAGFPPRSCRGLNTLGLVDLLMLRNAQSRPGPTAACVISHSPEVLSCGKRHSGALSGCMICVRLIYRSYDPNPDIYVCHAAVSDGDSPSDMIR
jgi:hypothetical protein